jgi:ankyrin repeat protein
MAHTYGEKCALMALSACLMLFLWTGSAGAALDEDLINAVQSRDRGKVEQLLVAGANPNATGNRGRARGTTALQYAVTLKGDKSIAESLLRAGAQVDGQGESGTTPLIDAAFWGNTEIVELLLAKGANVKAVDSSGGTALRAAVGHGHRRTVEVLLAKGADINAEASSAVNAVYVACAGGYLDLSDFFLSKVTDPAVKDLNVRRCFLAAAGRSQVDVMKMMLSRGVNVNQVDPATGGTALMWVDTKNAVELLLSNGAEVNAADRDGNNALHHFFGHGMVGNIMGRGPFGDPAIPSLLLAKGLDVKHLNKQKQSALHRCSGYGSIQRCAPSTIALLITHGTAVNGEDVIGMTPLHYAAHTGNAAAVQGLLSKGAEINAQSQNGNTPLHEALHEALRVPFGPEMPQLIERLVASGANVNLANGKGETPVQLAAEARHPEWLVIQPSRTTH